MSNDPNDSGREAEMFCEWADTEVYCNAIKHLYRTGQITLDELAEATVDAVCGGDIASIDALFYTPEPNRIRALVTDLLHSWWEEDMGNAVRDAADSRAEAKAEERAR